MMEERRGFYFDGETVWLTLTELQGRLSGTPTKHLLAAWENGAKKEAEMSGTNCPVHKKPWEKHTPMEKIQCFLIWKVMKEAEG